MGQIKFPLRLLITGGRTWNDSILIRKVLETIEPKNIKILINGGAAGADTIAATIAREMEIKVKTFKADWKKWGKKAGPLRNLEMVEKARPTFCLGFHREISKSKGTLHMLGLCEKKKIPFALLASHDDLVNPCFELKQIIHKKNE